jgi:hypothetical protein
VQATNPHATKPPAPHVPRPLKARDALALLGEPSLGGILITWAIAAVAWAAVLLP